LKRLATFLCLCAFVPLWLNSQSVEHLRNVEIKYKGGMKRSVKSFLFGKKNGEQVKPYALCRLGPDRLCVTDAVNGAVYIIDAEGFIKKKIARVKGIRLVSPVGVCTDDRDNLYISDSTRGGIVRFDPGYRFEGVFAAPTDSRITGIVFSNAVFYGVDTQNHRVLCFDRDGSLEFTFGKRGTGNGEFNFPTHICADNDFIYITDAMNFRVQIFDYKGAFVRVIGSWGRGGGNFSKPKGVAVDKKNRVFVTDAMFDNVQIFNREGRFLYFFGEAGHRDGEFWMPMGIMVGGDNTIWVADTYNNRLQVFTLLEDA